MKTFYCMKDASWRDRRKAEIAIRFIRLGYMASDSIVFQHSSDRLLRKHTRIYNILTSRNIAKEELGI